MKKLFVHFVLTAFMAVGFQQSVQAAMVSTAQVASAEVGAQARARLSTALQRSDVQAALERNGIDPKAAQARVSALSDEEAAAMAQQVDALPAGGDGVVGALVLIFVILLVTDILGLTKVFPFTRSVHR